jgi:hypothetical protein
MSRRGLVVLVSTVASVALLVPAVAAGLTIKPGQFGISKLGKYHPLRQPTLGHAIGTFGDPSTRDREFGGSGCLVRWRQYRLRIDFANFGGANPCSRSGGFAQKVQVGNSQKWQTDRHLRVGQKVSRLHRLYPAASRHGSNWWLKSAVSHIGGGGHYAVLAAKVDGGRVRGFAGWVGAAGD